MTYLALTLVLKTHLPVVDRTGITGNFDFEMDFTPFIGDPNDSSGPSIFTVIQEQLGLKLEPPKVPVEAMIIDRAESRMRTNRGGKLLVSNRGAVCDRADFTDFRRTARS
jgi:uncharacterized protein (TIGR03435 family)